MPTRAKPRRLTNAMRETQQQERSNRRTITHATESAKSLEATRTEQLAAREAGHTQARVNTQSALRRQRYVAGAQEAVVGKTVSTATPSKDSNLIMTTIFVMAGLIIMYQLVTKGPAVSGFLGGAGNWLHALSTNTPLFTPKVN